MYCNNNPLSAKDPTGLVNDKENGGLIDRLISYYNIKSFYEAINKNEFKDYKAREEYANKNLQKDFINRVKEDVQQIYRYGYYGGKGYTAGIEGDDNFKVEYFDKVRSLNTVDEAFKHHDQNSFDFKTGKYTTDKNKIYEANKKLVSELDEIINSGVIKDTKTNKLLTFNEWSKAMDNALMARDRFKGEVKNYEKQKEKDVKDKNK